MLGVGGAWRQQSFLRSRAFSCEMRYCCSVPRVRRRARTHTHTHTCEEKLLCTHAAHLQLPSILLMNVNDGSVERQIHPQ